MKSFKKIAILSTIFVAILGFFVWKYYQDKQEKEDYYNNVYTYSGDYEIGDYEFLGEKGVVAKWVSKDPEEDKQIRKHLKNDPQSKVEYHNNDVIMAGKRFIIRENFKTMSRKKGGSTYRLLIYDTNDQTLKKKEVDVLKWLREKGEGWGLSTVGPSLNTLPNGKEVLSVNIKKSTEKKVNGTLVSKTEIKPFYLDLETGKFIDYQKDSKKIEGLYYSINENNQGDSSPGDKLLQYGLDLNYNTVNIKKELFDKNKDLPIRKEYPKAYKILKEKDSAYYPTFNGDRSPKEILDHLSPLIPEGAEIFSISSIY
ncbi:hypothetical protein [Streptococcus parasanguinis]|uniref:hypothetical protein n=1 Tax=Streptococcus parasanguinis TaxID=1318 RepID=UPI0005F351B6|nr:hypothetical protein [Streptococcus parasanguinis]KJU89033.1 hypothetical protein TZ97_00745 [Streptococcus parasanguinis]